ESGVALYRGKGFEKRSRLLGIAGAHHCFGIKQRDAALLRCELVSAPQKAQGVRGVSLRRGKLAGTQKSSRGQSVLADPLRSFGKLELAVQALWIELRGAFQTKQRVFLAARLLK